MLCTTILINIIVNINKIPIVGHKQASDIITKCCQANGSTMRVILLDKKKDEDNDGANTHCL